MSKGYAIYPDKLEAALKAKGYGAGKTGKAAELIGRSKSYFTTTIRAGRIGPGAIKDINDKLGISPEIYVKVYVDRAQEDLLHLLNAKDDEDIDLAVVARERFPEEFKVYQRSSYEGTYAALVDFFKDKG